MIHDSRFEIRNSQLITEEVNPATVAIDTLLARQIVELINAEDAKVAPAVAVELDAIAAAVEAIVERLERGGRLIYVGAGTSGRLGILDAAECPPTFNTPPGQVVALVAGGLDAMTRSVEEAEDNEGQGRADVAGLDVGPDDVMVGISASGHTPYVLGAVAEARAQGAFTIGLSCNRPSPLGRAVDLEIAPLVGPEVIAGSTRMKAGTAQKMVLNMLSTASMILLGKTYANLMVDVVATNAKLRARATRAVALATGLGQEEARALLERCDGEARTAIVASLTGASPEEACRWLALARGRVHQALRVLGVHLPTREVSSAEEGKAAACTYSGAGD